MKKAIICATLTLALLLALGPCALAQGEPVISTGDFVYMGQYNDQPIKWRVLDAGAMNTGEPGAYLMSEYVLDKHGTAYDEYIVGWQGSLAQEWCGSFLATAFTQGEQSAIPAVTKHEEPKQLFGLRWGATELEEEKVFFLSSVELAEYVGDRDGAEGISACTPSGEVAYWWLRTSHQNHSDYSGLVLEDNQVHDFLVYIVWGCRPCMNLDYGEILNILPAYEGAEKEWKLTVPDGSDNIELGQVSLDGEKLTVGYSLSDFGEDRFITLLVRDGAGAVYSAERLCPADAAQGSLEIDMGALDIPQGGRLFLSCERDMGDYMTGYACKPVEIACTVSFDAGEGSGEMEPMSVVPGSAAELPDCGFSPAAGRVFDHWEMDGEPVEPGRRMDRDATLTAVYKNITVSSIDFGRDDVVIELFERTELSPAIGPEDAMDKSLSWSCEPKGIVSVTDKGDGSCTVKGRSPGDAVVSAKSVDGGALGSVTVTVTGSLFMALIVNYGLYILALGAAAGLLAVFIRKRKKNG